MVDEDGDVIPFSRSCDGFPSSKVLLRTKQNFLGRVAMIWVRCLGDNFSKSVLSDPIEPSLSLPFSTVSMHFLMSISIA